MRHLVIVAFVALWLSPTLAFAQYKYSEGDCITPTTESLRWNQRFAVVPGVFERQDIDDSNDAVYLLRVLEGSKPWQKNWDQNLVGASTHNLSFIDVNTVKVPQWMCVADQAN